MSFDFFSFWMSNTKLNQTMPLNFTSKFKVVFELHCMGAFDDLYCFGEEEYFITFLSQGGHYSYIFYEK